jgi:hypothetical protein
MGCDWVHLVLRPLFGLLYQPQMIDDCEAIGGMRIGRGNWSTRRKPASVSLCPPQIPHDLTRAPTRAAAVGSRRLTSWAMARPWIHSLMPNLNKIHPTIQAQARRMSIHTEIREYRQTNNDIKTFFSCSGGLKIYKSDKIWKSTFCVSTILFHKQACYIHVYEKKDDLIWRSYLCVCLWPSQV